MEGRTQFLSVVCMGCLEGAPRRVIRCRFCNQQWDGTSLVLGTMYSYDIFAAMPCCTERIKVSVISLRKYVLAYFLGIVMLIRVCFYFSATPATNRFFIPRNV